MKKYCQRCDEWHDSSTLCPNWESKGQEGYMPHAETQLRISPEERMRYKMGLMEATR